MRNRIAVGMICVFLYICLAPAAFAVMKVTEPTRAQQVRAGLLRIGTGDETRVAVRLQSGTRIKGFISAADDETFTISDAKTGLRRNVKYSDVAQIRAQNLTGGQKFAIGTAILVALILALGWAVGHSD
ncbi:MAG TPA: hypothetical protein VN622_03675 [Clostridia bacterium]|nr:hypothetical protein [Clostridia bacterium]